MNGKVLGIEAYATVMTNSQDSSDSNDPSLEMFFITKIGLSELCQKKTEVSVFLVFQGNHQPIENIEVWSGAPNRS